MLEKTAVILAGGRNSRMNYRNKSFLEYKGEKFIERIVNAVSLFSEKIIVSNEPELYEYLDVKVVRDIIPGRGPLSGIHSGLNHASYHESLVVACDMPFVTKELLLYIGQVSDGYDVTVPRTGNYLQPLCAVYSKNCIPSIEKCLQNNIRKIIEFYPEVKVKYVDAGELEKIGYSEIDKIFKNINTPEDYKKYCQID